MRRRRIARWALLITAPLAVISTYHARSFLADLTRPRPLPTHNLPKLHRAIRLLKHVNYPRNLSDYRYYLARAMPRAVAYVNPLLPGRVYLRPSAFFGPDLELAATLVHEDYHLHQGWWEALTDPETKTREYEDRWAAAMITYMADRRHIQIRQTDDGPFWVHSQTMYGLIWTSSGSDQPFRRRWAVASSISPLDPPWSVFWHAELAFEPPEIELLIEFRTKKRVIVLSLTSTETTSSGRRVGNVRPG